MVALDGTITLLTNCRNRWYSVFLHHKSVETVPADHGDVWALRISKTSMRRKLCALFALCGMALLATGPAWAGDITGVWLTANGESEIEIYACDDALCGRVARILAPIDPQSNPGTDVNNPDPALRTRPILGLEILTGLKPADDPDVWEGLVYNSRDGKTYAVSLTLTGDVLEVEGCVAYILCDSQEWTRVRPPQ